MFIRFLFYIRAANNAYLNPRNMKYIMYTLNTTSASITIPNITAITLYTQTPQIPHHWYHTVLYNLKLIHPNNINSTSYLLHMPKTTQLLLLCYPICSCVYVPKYKNCTPVTLFTPSSIWILHHPCYPICCQQ